MNRTVSPIRTVLSVPAFWIALAALALLVATNDPFIDIAQYAIQRLFP